jgi:hypothetical protein
MQRGGLVHVMDKQSDLKPAMQDVHQQVGSASVSAEVTDVRTPEELQAALSTGARHIEIINHLDLTTIQAATIDNVTSHPSKLGLTPSTWTIHVRLSPTSYDVHSVAQVKRLPGVNSSQVLVGWHP